MADHVPFAADSDGVYDADRRERWELEAVLDPLWPLPTDRPIDGLCAFWIDRAPRFGAVRAHFPERLRTRRGDPYPWRPTPWTGFAASFWAVEMFFHHPFGEVMDAESWYLAGGIRPFLDEAVALTIERRGASSVFWAPEVLLFGDLYLTGRQGWMFIAWPFSRQHVDLLCSTRVEAASALEALQGLPRRVGFWSPELPEVRVTLRPYPHQPEVYSRNVEAQPNWPWNRVRCAVLGLLLLALALPAGAQTLFGVVSRVSDGDTLTVGEARIRLYGIDAPESRQECQDARGRAYRCGDSAEVFLARLAPVGSSISCGIRDTDRYGRLVAICSVAQRAGSDLGRELVLAGWAVAYRKYSDRYVAEEIAAKHGKRGIWAGSFEQPEEWRKGGGR